jgi:hypothetical protein
MNIFTNLIEAFDKAWKHLSNTNKVIITTLLIIQAINGLQIIISIIKYITYSIL